MRIGGVTFHRLYKFILFLVHSDADRYGQKKKKNHCEMFLFLQKRTINCGTREHAIKSCAVFSVVYTPRNTAIDKAFS